MIPLIERYRDLLPVGPDTPIVSLGEGNTPLVPLPRLSERLGVELYAKFEGMNPTGSFKDRGMTMAVSEGRRGGRRGGHLRLDRQHLGLGGGLRRPRRPARRGGGARGQDRRRASWPRRWPTGRA